MNKNNNKILLKKIYYKIVCIEIKIRLSVRNYNKE